MLTKLRLKVSEITPKLINELKQQYGDKDLEINIHEYDETEYLLSSPVNKQKLEEALERLKTKQGYVQVDPKDLMK